MTFGLVAWEIDAAIVWHATGLAHRLACRAFVRSPNPFTGSALSAARSFSRAVARLSAPPSLNR